MSLADLALSGVVIAFVESKITHADFKGKKICELAQEGSAFPSDG